MKFAGGTSSCSMQYDGSTGFGQFLTQMLSCSAGGTRAQKYSSKGHRDGRNTSDSQERQKVRTMISSDQATDQHTHWTRTELRQRFPGVATNPPCSTFPLRSTTMVQTMGVVSFVLSRRYTPTVN